MANIYDMNRDASPNSDSIMNVQLDDGAGYMDKQGRSAAVFVSKETVGGYSNTRDTGKYATRWVRGAKRFKAVFATREEALAKGQLVLAQLVEWVDATKATTARSTLSA